mgnify:CR=1 FL=1
MSRLQILVLVAILGGAFILAGIFTWPMFSASWTSNDGSFIPLLVMIVGCFVLGGALMYLLFRSARSGRDDEVYRAAQGRDEPGEK